MAKETTRKAKSGRTGRTHLERTLGKIFSELRKRKILRDAKNPAVDIALLANDELKALKWKFLNKGAAVVDVLAFPNNDFPVPGEAPYLGEIYLNRDIVRESPGRGRFLLIHGMLHLLGYRHDNKHDIIKMNSVLITELNLNTRIWTKV